MFLPRFECREPGTHSLETCIARDFLPGTSHQQGQNQVRQTPGTRVKKFLQYGARAALLNVAVAEAFSNCCASRSGCGVTCDTQLTAGSIWESKAEAALFCSPDKNGAVERVLTAESLSKCSRPTSQNREIRPRGLVNSRLYYCQHLTHAAQLGVTPALEAFAPPQSPLLT